MLVRLEEHETISRAKVGQYRVACLKLGRETDEAYAKRNKWMAALVEIFVAHAPAEESDGCVCGSAEWPCVTRRLLRTVNTGIHRRVEEFDAMPDAERDRILYGQDYGFFEDGDDGVA